MKFWEPEERRGCGMNFIEKYVETVDAPWQVVTSESGVW
jgi:hypothetical protein